MDSPLLTRPCRAEIDLAAFAQNLRLLRSLAGRAGLAAVVKGDAYGHSLALCAPAARRAGADWLAVTSVDEARAAATGDPQADSRILVLSGPFPGDGPWVARHGFACSVWHPSHLEELQRGAQQAGASHLSVHLELDTGMSRQGAAPEELASFLHALRSFPVLRLDGVMTHLYAADESDHAATGSQLERLDNGLRQIVRHLQSTAQPAPQWLSVGNSAAILDTAIHDRLTALAEAHGLRLLLRPGIALYGVAPRTEPPLSVADEAAELRPVLTWKTRITSLRRIPAGEAIGYNATFRAAQPMRLALLAAGYADGLSRRLSNVGHALVAGQRAPFVGRISMDQAVVDVSHIPAASLAPGAEVILLGGQGGQGDEGVQRISADDHARWAETIPWEVFTSIAARVPRIAV